MAEPSPTEPARASAWRQRAAALLGHLRIDSTWPGLRNLMLLIAGMWLFGSIAGKAARLYYWGTVDDAAISMVFGKHLAQGQGVVFNLGERVEGYTNFTWVLLCALCWHLAQLLKKDYMAVVVGANLVLGVLATGLTYAVGVRLWAHRWLCTAIALAFILIDNSWTTWAAMGLENHLMTVCLLGTLLVMGSELPRRGIYVGLGLTAAMMTRPDAGLFVAVCFAELGAGALWAWLGRKQPLRVAAQDLALALGAFALVYVAYWLWRYQYYGYPFPNTYYLKLGAGKIDAWQRGKDYLRGFLEMREHLPMAALLGVLALRQRLARVIVAYTALHFAYVVYVGGDFFPGHRFFVAQIPLLALSFAAGLSALWSLLGGFHVSRGLVALGLPRAGFAGVVAAAFAGIGHQVYQRGLKEGPIHGEVMTWRDDLENSRRLMRWLRSIRPDGARITTGLIGHTGLLSEMYVIDLYGVVDPIAAHREVKNFGKGKAGHEKRATEGEALARRPDFIILGYLSDTFWKDGFYLDGSMPREIKTAGVWRRDTLASTHQKLPGTFGFEDDSFAAWTRDGDAFDFTRSEVSIVGHEHVSGGVGRHLTSFRPGRGDMATGRASSPPFLIEGDVITLRVGGGDDPATLGVKLVVDGAAKHSAVGRRSGMLWRASWDVSALRGKTATLELVDEATGGWGHIVVDEVEQWRRR
jgi:hypothetical protein